MQQLVECVPNFSNGRNATVYNSIADAIRGVRGITVLDVSADADHNRTVITFVGEPAAVEEAAFQAIATAARQIDLNHHSGEHPRIGATDVCPFIPVRGVTVADCIEMAQRLGQRVGEELGIAVYLYGAAATRPEREQLSHIRKGQYEKWKEEIGNKPERDPDYGPAEPKSWGATVIGVRPFLIAYNIFLNTDNVAIAEKIARAVRHSSGGLRFIQAKGFLVEGQAQVSMNFTNFEKTPLYRVQEMVRREAARYGCNVTKAELIGLAPQKALMDAARWYLQLDDMEDSQVLEYQLMDLVQEDEADISLQTFLHNVADKTPTPGGGSVAALAGALAAALTQMVAGLTAGRKKYAHVEADARLVLSDAAKLQQQLYSAVREDAAAFEALMAAYRNKEVNESERKRAIEQATIHAGEVPLRVARLARDVAILANNIAKVGNVNAASDAAVAAIMARAAVQGALLNVRTNATGVKDEDVVARWWEQVESLEAETADLVEQVTAVAAERGGF